MISSKRCIAGIAIVVILTGLYYVAGWLGLSLAFLNANTSAVWPPSGLALAAALLLGYRVWPAVFVGAFLVNWTTSHTIPSSLCIAIGNALEAVAGAMLTHRFAEGLRAFDRAGTIFRFLFLACIPSTAVSAGIGVTTLVLFGLGQWQNLRPLLLTWWLGDAISQIVLAPLLVVWLTRPLPRLPPRRLAEAAALLVLLVIVGQTIFGGLEPFDSPNLPIAYLAMPVLIWAAFRFHQHGATLAAFKLSAIAIIGTIGLAGPFAVADRNTSLLLLQGFVGVVTLATLVLAALSAERSDVEASLRQSETRARAAHEEAERANRSKDRFLAVLSHELRTPLTPVLAIASVLDRDPSLSPELREDIAMIRRNVELEARLIDDLLDLTRIARGKLQLSVERTDVHVLIGRAVEISGGCPGALAVELDLAAADHHVLADPARLQQVLWNLLNNAQKYTPADAGRIVVRTRNIAAGPSTCGEQTTTATTTTGSRRLIVVEVSDNGMGIEPELLPRLFMAFEQGQAASSAREGGLGLGLAISKALVSALGGELRAHSPGRGCGSTFGIELPVMSGAAETPSSAVANGESNSVTATATAFAACDLENAPRVV